MRIHAYENNHVDRITRKRRTDDILANLATYDGQIYYRRLRDGKYVLSPIVDGHIDFEKTVYEHRLVYELANGIELDATTRITHINGDDTDNRIENLSVDKTHFSRPSKDELKGLIKGYTDREIAERFGVRRHTVYKWRRFYGFPPENGYRNTNEK